MEKVFFMNTKIIIISLFFLISCKAFVQNNYQLGRQFRFASKKSYLNYLTRQKGFDRDKIIFIDSASYTGFLKDVLIHEGCISYLGIYLNDSLSMMASDELKNEELLNTNKFKAGISKLFKPAATDSNLQIRINLAHYHFKYLKNNANAFPGCTNKNASILFIYSFTYGSYYDTLYKAAIAMAKRNRSGVELFIIVIDEVFPLR